ncbi:MAG: RNA polymerase factor sigma-54 [Verrucomicrobiaceae bacterium]|nr:RNA polymerase factor sigma-54 [Verrucomicrobiaceae bacterium]
MHPPGLVHSQAQKPLISTQMQHRLHLLQATALELQQLVQQEMNLNPVLELDPDEPPDDEELENEDDSASDNTPDEQEWDDYWADAPLPNTREDRDEQHHEHLMQSITGVTSLSEFLREQITLWPQDDPHLAGDLELLIGFLDERGILSLPLAEIATTQKVPLARMKAAQAVLTTFDPPGIGADDLRHSLLIQLERREQSESLAAAVLSHHFDDLAARRLPRIAQALGFSLDDITHATRIIATLHPSPASSFTTPVSPYVTTDLIVEREGEGWKALLTGQDMPRLRISPAYKALLAESSAKDARDYLRDHIKSGKQLISTLAQRQETLRRIAEEIIKYQPDFFAKGRAHLQPLTMSPIARALGVHESTISRAIAGKHLQTPHGLFELRFFFTPGLTTRAGPDLSNTAVKESLAALIRTEDKAAPLSDTRLTQLLATQGISIARRTTAKYREDLSILPANLRRQF